MVYTHLRSRDTQEEGMFSKNNVTTQHQNRRLFSINHDLINMTEIPRTSRSPRMTTAKKSLRNRSNDDEESMSAHQKVSILKHAIGNLAESINQEFNILRQELIPSDSMLKQIKENSDKFVILNRAYLNFTGRFNFQKKQTNCVIKYFWRKLIKMSKIR